MKKEELMKQEFDHEEFVDAVNKHGNGEYEILSLYINKRTSVILDHTPCGERLDVKPVKFVTGLMMHGIKCSTCELKRISRRGIEKELETKGLAGEYEVVSTEKHLWEPCKIKHLPCGKESVAYYTRIVSSGLSCKCSNVGTQGSQVAN